MKDRKPSTNVPVIFQNLEEYEHADSRFLKIKIWLMHTLENLNGSSFSKEAVDKAIPSLANTPLLAFIEENSEGEQDFSDHRMVLHRTEDGNVDFKYMGEYVGVIPESNNAKWELRMTDNGEMKEYLTVEALMWTKRNDPVDIMRRKGFTSQSMELADDYTGHYDENGVFHFDNFKFFGACLLGNDVLPAMKNSTAEIQFSKNEDIQKNIEDKLQEFYTLFSQEGGHNMAKENEQDVNVEETEVVETAEAETEAVEPTEENFNVAPEDGSGNPEKFTEDEKEDKTETPAEDADGNTEKVGDPDGAIQTESEITDTVADDIVLNEEKEDFEVKFNELKDTHTSLRSEFATLQSQLSELQTYKRQREENDLKSKFEGKLSEEEFTQVFTDFKEDSLEKVEDKLFALIGKKNFSTQSTQKNNTNKVAILSPNEEVTNPYGGIFD